MQRFFAFAVSAAALLAAASGPTFANENDIVGLWKVRVPNLSGACRIDGEMTVTRVATNRYACALNTQEKCPGYEGGAKQSCTAERKGDALTIKSKVLSFTWDKGNYAPDDFNMTIVSSDYMRGEFSSTHANDRVDRGDAEFFRGPAPTS